MASHPTLELFIGIRGYLTELNAGEVALQLSDLATAFPHARSELFACGAPVPPEWNAAVSAIHHYAAVAEGLGRPNQLILDAFRTSGAKHLLILDGSRTFNADALATHVNQALRQSATPGVWIAQREQRVVFTRDTLDGRTLEDISNAFIRLDTPTSIPDLASGAILVLNAAPLLADFDAARADSWANDAPLLIHLLSRARHLASSRVATHPARVTTSNRAFVFKQWNALEKLSGRTVASVARAMEQDAPRFFYGGNLGFIDPALDAYRQYQYRERIGGMRALILAGGNGTRLRPFTLQTQKQILPVANKPILHYIIDKIKRTGITHIGVIVGPNADQVKHALGDGSAWNVQLTYIYQDQPAGLAHAVATAKDYLGDTPFLMYLGDNLLGEDLTEFLTDFLDGDSSASLFLNPVSDPTQYGIATVDHYGRILKLDEKPKHPASNLAIVGIYAFRPDIHHAIRRIQPSARGELEITDAIQELLNQKRTVTYRRMTGWWEDTGSITSMLDANALILDEQPSDNQGTLENGALVKGRVRIGTGTTIHAGATVLGPAAIGEDCQIEKGAVVGPYASVGNGCRIGNATLVHTIVLDHATIQDAPPLSFSIIGANATVKGKNAVPPAFRTAIVDNRETRTL